MIAFARVLLQLLADVASLAVLALRPRRSLEAENLFLRRELALYQERGVKPRRVDAATPLSLALLSRHQIGGRLVLRVISIMGGLHHEYSLAPQVS